MKFVYILKSLRYNQIYVGVTNDLKRRLEEHNYSKCSHTSKQSQWEIVYFEEYELNECPYKRERQIKKWTRAKKEALICGHKTMLRQLSKKKR